LISEDMGRIMNNQKNYMRRTPSTGSMGKLDRQIKRLQKCIRKI